MKIPSTENDKQEQAENPADSGYSSVLILAESLLILVDSVLKVGTPVTFLLILKSLRIKSVDLVE